MREVWGAAVGRRGEAVGGAQDAGGAAVEDVGVAEGRAGGALGDALTAYRLLHRALQHGFVQVVAAALTGLAVQYERVAGKTHCQIHSRPALGYLRPRAQGSSTQPAPARR